MSRLHITNTLSRLHMWYWVIYSCDMELKITNSSPLKITNSVGLLHININKREHITNSMSHLHLWCDEMLSHLKITNSVGFLHINKREHITNSMSHLHMWCDEMLSHLKITSSNHTKITNSMSHLHINKSCAYHNSMTWLTDIWMTRWVRDQFVLSSWSLRISQLNQSFQFHRQHDCMCHELYVSRVWNAKML